MRTVQEAWPAREDRCPPTKSNADKVKKRPRTLADVPQAVLHKEIFRFDALQRENAHLRSEEFASHQTWLHRCRREVPREAVGRWRRKDGGRIAGARSAIL